MTFAEYLYEKQIDPFDIALKSKDELNSLRAEWDKNNKPKVKTEIYTDKSFDNLDLVNNKDDVVYNKLSSLNLKIANDKLVKIIQKMTKDDKDQTNKVGSWIYYCLNKNLTKANASKIKVSSKYVNTMEKHIDSFIKMLDT